MKEPDSNFQIISLRRRISISIGMLSVLIIVIGLYSLTAIFESNQRLHRTVIDSQAMAKAIDSARLSQVHFKKQVQEWKDLLLRGQEKDLFDIHFKAFNEEDRKTGDYLKSLLKITSDTQITVPQIADAIKAHEELGKQYREALEKYRPLNAKNVLLIDKSVRGIDRKLIDEVDAIVGIVKKQAEQKLIETESTAKTKMEAYYVLTFFILFLMIAAVAFSIFNILSITRELPSENNKNGSEIKNIKKDA